METTIKIICALIAILMLTSCNRKPIPAVYDYEVYKTQEIKLEENDSNCHILGQQMVQIDGRDVIVLLMWEKRKLSFYDLKTEKKINFFRMFDHVCPLKVVDDYYKFNI